MRVIHTADLHLSKDRPETLKVLKHILDICKDRSADILTIGGDIFDSERDAEILRPQLRRLFTDNNFKIFAIPGNHDREAYARNLDFGPDLNVATEEPFEIFRYEETAIVGVPFRDIPSEELYSELADAARDAKTRLLLLHCTLDIGFGAGDFGEEGAQNYFPVTTATLSKLGYDYVLSGHFHTQTTFRSLEEGGLFVYPGSPVSHTRKEIGRRQAVVIDTDARKHESISLNSFYYDRVQIDVRPGEEKHSLEEAEEWVNERADHECKMEIAVRGFLEMDEKMFRKSLDSLGNNVKVQHEYRNVKLVLEHPLYHRFKEKLDGRDDIDDENKRQVESRVLDVISQLLAGRELGA